MISLTQLTKQVTERYRHDEVAPGLVIAWIAERGTWYCSVRRYAVATPEALRTHVVTAYESTDYETALQGLVHNWRRLTVPKQQPLPKKPVTPYWDFHE